jgi:hypothetical protein
VGPDAARLIAFRTIIESSYRLTTVVYRSQWCSATARIAVVSRWSEVDWRPAAWREYCAGIRLAVVRSSSERFTEEVI